MAQRNRVEVNATGFIIDIEYPFQALCSCHGRSCLKCQIIGSTVSRLRLDIEGIGESRGGNGGLENPPPLTTLLQPESSPQEDHASAWGGRESVFGNERTGLRQVVDTTIDSQLVIELIACIQIMNPGFIKEN